LLQVAAEVSNCRGPFGDTMLKSNILRGIISFQQDPRQKLESGMSNDEIFFLTSTVLQNIILPPPDKITKSKLVYFQNEIENNSYLYRRNIRKQSRLLSLSERIVIYCTAQFAVEGSTRGFTTRVLCTIFYTLLMTSQISADHDVSQLIGLVLFTLEESEKLFLEGGGDGDYTESTESGAVFPTSNNVNLPAIISVTSDSLENEQICQTEAGLNLEIKEEANILPQLDFKEPVEGRDHNENEQSVVDVLSSENKLLDSIDNLSRGEICREKSHTQKLDEEEVGVDQAEITLVAKTISSNLDGGETNIKSETKNRNSRDHSINIVDFSNGGSEIVTADDI